MAKQEVAETKRERKSSPIHVEKLLAQEHAGAQPVWIKDAEYPTVAVARDNIKASIVDGDTNRLTGGSAETYREAIGSALSQPASKNHD